MLSIQRSILFFFFGRILEPARHFTPYSFFNSRSSESVLFNRSRTNPKIIATTIPPTQPTTAYFTALLITEDFVVSTTGVSSSISARTLCLLLSSDIYLSPFAIMVSCFAIRISSFPVNSVEDIFSY